MLTLMIIISRKEGLVNISFKEKFRLEEKIKIQRLNDKKSLRKLASECEMSYATLYDIENGNGFPTEKVLISLVKNLNFKDKTEIYNLYAEIKESAPPDIIDFLVKNKDVVDAVRKIIEEKERCNHGY